MARPRRARRRAEIAALLLLTFVFWTSGLAKLIDFAGNAAIMEDLGLRPGWLFNAAALALFTLLTIPIAHPFWSRQGEEAFRDLTVALEHVSVIGGLALATLLSARRCRR